MVVLIYNFKLFTHSIKIVSCLLRIKSSGKAHSIYTSELFLNPKSLTVFLNKTDIKRNIVAYKNAVSAKIQELWQSLLYCRFTNNHVICNAGKPGCVGRYRNLGINKLRKAPDHCSFFYLHRPNLDYLALYRRQSYGFEIKYDQGTALQLLSLVVKNYLEKVINKVAFNS